ncbi:hypothetical protein [Mesorhizobium sp.]|uniref:hypothetical protein n=1 Tax=Mesorhizobium sp. TaxID=1871066 RepID=UPI000FE3005A|nr:hypothetical protein [Mesorhizobium sp.]RWN51934.1 MAG: hypothetical protein EOR98_24070 [Mesorhizobium sp.]RWN73057.1 MAG: hypothetical protein EOS02_25530 [Mesorhizobium sp.]RWN76239.1 MAG: hypothetical protein EOS01_21245 [Mesorhizobium sp.]RWN85985.1 MAG: hypothetical protein EOS04_20640 [Mesorhizobium sp.]RWO11750.1 MAG: hypothetical protein EOS15_21870 [Mesorhizobium sp.]
MKTIIASACIGLGVLVQPTLAGPYVTVGPGAQSCGRWVKANESSRVHGMSWVLGFMTAMNLRNSLNEANGNVTSGADTDSMELWLVNYCSGHPLDDLNEATLQLYFELSK